MNKNTNECPHHDLKLKWQLLGFVIQYSKYPCSVGHPPSQGTANGKSGHPWRFPKNLSKPAERKVFPTPEPPCLPVSLFKGN